LSYFPQTAQDLVQWAVTKYADRFAVLTSFQIEGMVIVDMAVRISPQVRVLTLDTGRLPAETYQMIETVRERYGISVEMVSPDAGELESMVTRHGPDLFYREVPLRMLCCHIRKVRPLERKLAEFDAYAVGLRREQSESRADILRVDESSKPVKLSPLADWTREQVAGYVREHNVPLHPLYAQGYTSIGCAPCTRAVAAGEDERAGRWWWEQEADKECGLHFSPSGKAQRTVDVLIAEVLH
jgi:phosphoadenosine phosphosulfate reductase